MKKIVILIPTLTTGGGEKIAASHANDLAELGYDISIIVPQGNIHQKINQNVKLITGENKNLISSMFFCRKQLRIISPDIVLSYMERANFINCCIAWREKWKAITSIHTVPSVAYKNRNILNRIFISITMRIMKKLNTPIICVSSGVQQELVSLYDITNTFLVPNYLFQDNEPKIYNHQPDRDIVFGFVGRLNKVKGCDLFLEAISRYPQDKNKKFWIIGDGPEKHNLLFLSKKIKESDNITFFGEIKSPSAFFKKIDYLIVPSYVEGFGLVVLEGLYYGCSIIYSECKYGPKEIMNNLEGKCISFPFFDPSINKELAVKQLSKLIYEIKNKRDNYSDTSGPQQAMLNEYSKEKSLQKIIDIFNG